MDTVMLKEILSYIDMHIYEKISLDKLAGLAGYSPFYFSKLFSEAMGIPVTGYIRIRKLQYALVSLQEGKKVLDVALLYSFESHEGFTRAFTQLFGTSPSKVRKYLSSYQVPEYEVPNKDTRRIHMEGNRDTLLKDMHEIVYEVIRTSMKEAKEGYCTEINVWVMGDGKIKIADNGRGIPLSNGDKNNQQILDRILSGHPITSLDYARMGDLQLESMQIVNSLCESLQITVYRKGYCYKQDYVRGIAQHDVVCQKIEHDSGTEIVLKADKALFGDIDFSADLIKAWVTEHIGSKDIPRVNIRG